MRLTSLERKAGLFLIGTVVILFTAVGALIVQRGFFEQRLQCYVNVPSGAGLREGAAVFYRGLKVGRVQDIELSEDSGVRLTLALNQKAARVIPSEAKVRLTRPFVLAEKNIELRDPEILKTDASIKLAAGHEFEFEETLDLVDLMSGPQVGALIEEVGVMYSELKPMLQDARLLVGASRGLVVGLNQNKKTEKLIQSLSVLSQEMSILLPRIAKESPDMFENLVKVTKNTALITDELTRVLPLVQSAAPEVPKVSRRAIEALDETVVTLKALQKSFLLSGNVKEVRAEELKRQTDDRLPASSTQQPGSKADSN